MRGTARIIGLSGYARSGKDTVAGVLVEKYGFEKLALADPMREALYRLNPLVGRAHLRLQRAVDTYGWEQAKTMFPEIRCLLQRFGTEVGREMFGEDFWIEQTFRKIKAGANYVIADVRFENEARAIRRRGGELWQVSRLNVGPANGHRSETEHETFDFDRVVLNYGTVEELHARIVL